MNTAHAKADGMKNIIRNARRVSSRIAIMIDTKGPEIRTTAVTQPLEYKTGETVRIVGCPDLETVHDCVYVSYPHIAKDVKVGDH